MGRKKELQAPKEERGRLLVPEGRKKQFYDVLSQFVSACGLEPNRRSQERLDSRQMSGSPHSGKFALEFEKVDRARLSGLFVLIGIVETLCDYDSGFAQRHSTESVLSFVRPLEGMDHALAIKRLKYVTAYWTARILKNELPVPDDPSWDPWQFKGSVRQYLKRLVCARGHSVHPSAKRVQTVYSLLQAKRACDPVPESFVKDAFKKHRLMMSKDEGRIDDDLRGEIEWRTDEILSTWKPFRDRLCEPSHSACFEKGRGDGGQHAAIMTELTGYNPMLVGQSELLAMIEVAPGIVQDRRGWAVPRRCEVVRMAYANECVKGQMACKVESVLEPLKVRTITKGRALAYYAVHGLQKWMHGNLRSTEQFRLIGETITEAPIKQLMSRRLPGELFVSGDYSAATDHLKIGVTKAIFERILLKMMLESPDPDTDVKVAYLARKVLYEHRIVYPKYSGLEDVRQMNGQLMGSPLSFPILCIANALCYWISQKPEARFQDLPCLVNGDDVAFSATPEKYARWEELLPRFGFVKSIGKNYLHERYVMINSELFDASYAQSGRCHLPYFCSGLLLGRSKVQKSGPSERDDGAEPAPPIIASLELCLRGAHDPTRTLSRYMYYHQAEVREITRGKMNLFLPITRGGFGLRAYGAEVWRRSKGKFVPAERAVSLWQRKYAARLAQERVLKTGRYTREADEPGAWKDCIRVRDDDLQIEPEERPEEEQPEIGFLPGLSRSAHERFQRHLHRRSKAYAHELRPNGPPGWRVLDSNGLTKWRFSPPDVRPYAPLNDSELAGELPYRFAAHPPVTRRSG
jgi:hypothetical protein